VEFASLTARIDVRRQIAKQRSVELPAGEFSCKRSRIDANDARSETALDHFFGERAGRPLPQRKHRFDSGAGEPTLAIAADVLEKEIAKRDALDAFRHGASECSTHDGVVIVVRARCRNLELPQRQRRGGSLRFEQLAPDAVHGHSIEFARDRRQQRDDLITRI